MSTRGEFRKVKFFCGVIYRHERDADSAIALFQEIVSGVDGRSADIPFDATGYYKREMGEPLFRRFVSFREWRDPASLPQVKMAAMQLEEQLAVNGCRTVNLDPGYLSEANVIIATAKNHYHRVPLRDGIYAHIEYVLKDGIIQFLPWTYPDFKTGPYLDFFARLKEMHRMERKGK